MFYMIGLGLADEKDITVKGLEIVKKASKVYLESYTSILLVDTPTLEGFYGRPVIVADRDLVESDQFVKDAIEQARTDDIAFLVVGDPFGATTHSYLALRARELNVPVICIPNASVMTSVGALGLQLYTYGQTVSMPFFNQGWRPSSWYEKIAQNVKIGLHTLILLDIKVKEQTMENLMRKRAIYEPPRYMTVAQSAQQMLEVIEEKGTEAYSEESLVIGAARLGSSSQHILCGTLKELAAANMGPPLHCMVLVGSQRHDLERDFLAGFAIDRASFESSWGKMG